MHRSHRAFAAVLCVVAVTACGHGGAGNQGPPPLAVDVAHAQRQDIATYVSLDGQIAPLQQATLSTPQSGTVVAVYANEGQRVHAGQLLAKLDDSTLRAQLAQMQALVQQSDAQLGSATLQGNITPAAASATVATAQQQLQAAQNNYQTAVAALANAKLVNDSNQTLLKQGYVAQTAAMQSQASYVQAQQALIGAQQTVRQAEVALQSAKASGVNAMPIQNQAIAQQRATLKSAQAQVRLLQAQIVQTSLIAPFDGAITQRLLDPGAFAGPNQPILQISQIDQVYVNINVPDNDLEYVRRGTPVTFTSGSVPGRTFTGAIFDVNATPTAGTLSYRARVVKSNPDDALRGGMLVAVSVRQQFEPNAIVIPATAVVQNGPTSGVFIVVMPPAPPAGKGPPPGGGAPAGPPGGKPGAGPPGGALQFAQAKFVPVTVGLQTDTLAAVRSPQITAGTTVITTRPDALQDKSLVAFSPPASGGGAPRGVQAPQVDPP